MKKLIVNHPVKVEVVDITTKEMFSEFEFSLIGKEYASASDLIDNVRKEVSIFPSDYREYRMYESIPGELWCEVPVNGNLDYDESGNYKATIFIKILVEETPHEMQYQEAIYFGFRVMRG